MQTHLNLKTANASSASVLSLDHYSEGSGRNLLDILNQWACFEATQFFTTSSEIEEKDSRILLQRMSVWSLV